MHKLQKDHASTTKSSKRTQNAQPLRIYQIAEGYCYNSDTLFLWNCIQPYLRPRMRVLELGSGSGVLGLLCARDCEIMLYQIECQPIYALMNAKNAQSNHIISTIIHANCNELALNPNLIAHLHDNSLAQPHKLQSLLCQMSETAAQSPTINAQLSILQSHKIPQSLPYFDCIISNPPFYPPDTLISNNPMKAIATQSHNLPFETMLKLAKRVLKPNGRFIFCYTPILLGEIFETLRTYRFGIEKIRFIHPRLDKAATLMLICVRANSNPQTHILPPLITHNGKAQQDNTQEVQAIYAAAHTQSIKIARHDIDWTHFL